MNELKIVRKCFACTAFVFAFVSFGVLPALIRAPFPHVTTSFRADIAGIILIFMRELILFLPPVLAIVNGIAWWAIRNGLSSARNWAITASTLFMVYSIPFFVADIVILEYRMSGALGIIGVFLSFFMFSGLGVTGLAYFTRCEAMAPAPVVIRHI